MNLRNADWLQLKKIPNNLTIIRLLFVPVLLIIFPINHYITDMLTALLFLVAALTDFFDGFFARKYNSESKLGALLDPVADKVLAITMLMMLCSLERIPTLLAGLLIMRDVLICGIRAAAAEHGVSIAVSKIGKYKTAALWISIFCLIIDQSLFRVVGMIGVWIALILSVWSAYEYWRQYCEQVESEVAPKS
ncbi:MAG: CDP-diacylglycerol--glycerol-3-phosphate 3-phosphatidyltransferase [Pseudomonadota bacterium]|nr:CDP-diacylglycerol--glycerol-3-phosphate 3-phosphatidyltransferase [Pseudomonadota bacterium]